MNVALVKLLRVLLGAPLISTCSINRTEDLNLRIDCVVIGSPSPNLYFYTSQLNIAQLALSGHRVRQFENRIVMDVVKEEVMNTYRCVAENVYGSDSSTLSSELQLSELNGKKATCTCTRY